MNRTLSHLTIAALALLSLLSAPNPCFSDDTVTASATNPLTKEALAKITTLESKMEEAQTNGIDVTREETVVWFAKEFLKYADWDERNQDAVAYLFGEYAPYKEDKDKLAAEIPDFQRKKVVGILDGGIAELSRVISGEIKRRPVNKVDWQNIEVGDNMLINSNGRPVFLYDYFSKSVGRPLTDTSVYNDHLGAIFHGGENLYPPEHDRAINSFLLKEDRTFDQELLREVTGISESNVGFLIYWNQGIPEWVEKLEPEVRFGRSTFTGFDIDNPLVREVWGTIARETGALTKGKKVTQLGYILANEPHWHSIASGWTKRTGEMQQISSYTLNGFRNWLRKKYDGDLDQLNKNWGADFTSFETVEIEIPIPSQTRGTPMFYDWARYSMDRAIDWYAFIQGELRTGNPDADTHIKNSTHLYSDNDRAHGIDLEALTELTSMIGDDAKTRPTRMSYPNTPEAWEEHYAYCWEELSMSYDFMESVSPEKIHVNSESHFLSASRWRKLDTSVEYVESVYWLATLQGMDANMAWFWARDPDGSPEDRLEGELEFADLALAGSFAGSVNQQPHIANAYTQVMYDLNSFSEEIIALRQQRRPLRLFHSETSAINKQNHMTQQFAVYEKLFFEGFPVGFATENIIKKQDNQSWDAILVYRTEFVTDSELDSLQSYLDQGGTLIIDSERSLSKNEYGEPHSKSLNQGNGELIILSGEESTAQIRDFSFGKIVSGLPDVTLDEDNGSDHKGCRWLAVKRDDGSYLVSILNIGKNNAKLKIGIKDHTSISVTDLFTGKSVASEFDLDSKSVSLLEVRPL
ncbi:alpha-amylase family protein [Aporhodopirellula aestuarii]|uniref:Beta-galactosidase n=1 Tax=Aporhodopirellula aestuarii TaxID=2950107 RepID=A0ABT0U9V2_9BACT|nr:alpha-amylase family protein [Aporhodopirellula aestuarii]MCM2373464.1 beta-galactosidase [Aporhodopirellula aestuarii]